MAVQTPEISSTPQQPAWHRLPTVSASAALSELQESDSSNLPLGVATLDAQLSGNGDGKSAGLERGKVTEIWGPKGAGKTALILQAAANAIKNDGDVVWVDCSAPLSGPRLQNALSTETPDASTETHLHRFRHLTIPTLSHLLALTLHPPPTLIPAKTSLLVLESANTLVDLDYPRSQAATSNKSEQQKWQANRRYAILGTLVSSLNKLAVLNNLAVVVTTGCSSRMRPDSGMGAALAPGVGGGEWDGGIWSRLVVFRDFPGRFVGVQKCQGKSLVSRDEAGYVGRLVGFDVTVEGAVRERRVEEAVAENAVHSSPTKPRKRNFDEVADSDGEDTDEYGWADADENAVPTEGLISHGQAKENGETAK